MIMPNKSFRLRSFVRRDSRQTFNQRRALLQYMPHFGLTLDAGLLQAKKVFGRKAMHILEIGFGSGQSLLHLAKLHADKDFIGIETHKPGIGALLLGIEQQQLTNIRIYNGDAVDILQQCIPDESLSAVLIFFPDPWPKRRHHGRRLIQSTFIHVLVEKLNQTGELHVATDWEDYAKHMMSVLSKEKKLQNCIGENQYATRSPLRPIITKFEARAESEKRMVYDLCFRKG